MLSLGEKVVFTVGVVGALLTPIALWVALDAWAGMLTAIAQVVSVHG